MEIMMTHKAMLRQIFQTECEELISKLESSLMELEKSPQDTEIIHQIFRAAHTLKGNAGMIGLDDFVDFAHVMESVLDRIRDNAIPVEEKLISVLLDSTDVVKAILSRFSQDLPIKETPGYQEQYLRLSQYLISDTLPVEKTRDGGSTGAPQSHLFRIRMKFAPDIFEQSQDPFLMIRELSELGEIIKNKPCVDALPFLEDLAPQQLYVWWELVLRTFVSRGEVEGVFIFLDSTNNIEIQEINEKMLPELLKEGSSDPVEPEQRAPLNESNLSSTKTFAANAKRETVTAPSSIRVPTEKLDRLVNLVGEMVIVLAQVSRNARDPFCKLDSRILAVEVLERIGKDLQEHVMAVRMIPLDETFSRFKRVVRDTAKELGKSVEIEISGTETELDKNVIEFLIDPIKHMLRNCLAHGIETPNERIKQGKNETGRIMLHAEQREGHILIEVSDDGRGIDLNQVLSHAKEKGFVRHDAVLTPEEITNLIFLPGFSTSASVNEISGRGVGLDVVRQNIANLRGTVAIRSVPKQGTTFTIKLPLTLAIIEGMSVQVGQKIAIIPLLSVNKLVASNAVTFHSVEGSEAQLVRIGDEPLPLVNLAEILCTDTNVRKDETIVVVETGSRKIGLLVDKVLGVEQAVIKPLDTCFSFFSRFDPTCMLPESVAGATILGDGTVGLILDVYGIERVAFGAVA
jgi:two-component system chemotaxis sensor kinase CheA